MYVRVVPSACNELSDGYHYIQPLTESELLSTSDTTSTSLSAPPIKVMCSNGYTIVNPKLDPNVINYFSSYHDYHASFSGPSLDDHVSWGDWWLPAKADTAASGEVTPEVQPGRFVSVGGNRRLLGKKLHPLSESDRIDKQIPTDDPWYNQEVLDTVTKWSLSEDCNSCLDEEALDYGTATAYYMTGDNYGV